MQRQEQTSDFLRLPLEVLIQIFNQVINKRDEKDIFLFLVNLKRTCARFRDVINAHFANREPSTKDELSIKKIMKTFLLFSSPPQEQLKEPLSHFFVISPWIQISADDQMTNKRLYTFYKNLEPGPIMDKIKKANQFEVGYIKDPLCPEMELSKLSRKYIGSSHHDAFNEYGLALVPVSLKPNVVIKNPTICFKPDNRVNGKFRLINAQLNKGTFFSVCRLDDITFLGKKAYLNGETYTFDGQKCSENCVIQ